VLRIWGQLLRYALIANLLLLAIKIYHATKSIFGLVSHTVQKLYFLHKDSARHWQCSRRGQVLRLAPKPCVDTTMIHLLSDSLKSEDGHSSKQTVFRRDSETRAPMDGFTACLRGLYPSRSDLTH
jgi:hypothetical protein